MLYIEYKNIVFPIRTNTFRRAGLSKIVNNIFIVDPDLCKCIVDNYESIKYATIYSEAIVSVKCPICNTIKKMKIRDLFDNGIACKVCGKGISYPEKFFKEVLKQVGIDFETEYLIKGYHYYYDFYIPQYNLIIETDGGQHNKNGFNITNNKWHNPERDMIKTKICKHCHIKIIRINCYKSDKEYIKNSILNNIELLKYLNFDNVDWDKCDFIASKTNTLYLVIDMWNKNYKDPEIIANKLKLSDVTVRRNLRKAEKLGLLNNVTEYLTNLHKEKIKNTKYINDFRPIEVLKNGESYGVFYSPRIAKEYFLKKYSIKFSDHIVEIADHKNGRRSSKGFTFEWVNDISIDNINIIKGEQIYE